MSTSALNKTRLDQLVGEVRQKVRSTIYQRQNWYQGTDVCKVLGLIPTPGRKSYQSLFSRLCEQEKVTLSSDLVGDRRSHRHVMVNSDGVYALALIALERQAVAEARNARLSRQAKLNERQTNVQAG